MHKYTKKYKTIKESIKKNAKPTEGLGIYFICRKRQTYLERFADYLTNFLPFWIAMPLKLELTR